MAVRASGIKMGDDGGGLLISPDGVAPSWIVGVSASVIFPCTIKSRTLFFWRRLTWVVPKNGCKMVLCGCLTYLVPMTANNADKEELIPLASISCSTVAHDSHFVQR